MWDVVFGSAMVLCRVVSILCLFILAYALISALLGKSGCNGYGFLTIPAFSVFSSLAVIFSYFTIAPFVTGIHLAIAFNVLLLTLLFGFILYKARYERGVHNIALAVFGLSVWSFFNIIYAPGIFTNQFGDRTAYIEWKLSSLKKTSVKCPLTKMQLFSWLF